MAKPEILAAIAALGLSMSVEFVPWSKSRSATPTPKMADRSLNWRVTLLRDGREVLTTDYTAGIAHCPSYNPSARPTLEYAEKIARETETGRRWDSGFRGVPILPDLVDVVASLAMDSDVIDHPTFESWASDLGFDTDSRKAEADYRACLATALQLRAALGDAGLAMLREATQDY